MKLWLINHYAYSPSDSASSRHFDLSRELLRLGHEVHVLSCSFYHKHHRQRASATGGRRWSETLDGVHFHWLPAPTYEDNSLRRYLNIAGFAAQLLRPSATRSLPRPDVVLGSSPDLASALSAYVLARLRRAPFVFEVRDLWPDTFVDLGFFSPRHPLVRILRRVERFLYRHADVVVSVLPGAAERIRRLARRPVEVIVVPNGVDLSQRPLGGERTDHDGTFEALYAGAHGPANQLDLVLDAAAHLMDRGANHIRLSLLGDGSEKPRLIRRAAAEGLENVRFLDPIAKRDVHEALLRADVGLLLMADSPLYRWGFSQNKLWDYFAAALPVICTGGFPYDPVNDAAAGVTVPPGSADALSGALLQLASTPRDELTRLGMNGRRYVEANHDTRTLAARLSTTMDALRSIR